MFVTIFILFGILISTNQALADDEATFFYVKSSMASDVVKHIMTNDLIIPITLTDVGQKPAMDLSVKLGKKCGLNGVMLAAYPLLVHNGKCIVNDKMIIDYMNKNKIVTAIKNYSR